MRTRMVEQSAANSSSQTRPVWWRDWQRLWGCHPGHAQAWLVVPLRGGSGQAANPCRGSGVWQQWLRQLEINSPAGIVPYCFAYLFMAGTATEGFRAERGLANADTKLHPNSHCITYWPCNAFSLTLSFFIFQILTGRVSESPDMYIKLLFHGLINLNQIQIF